MSETQRLKLVKLGAKILVALIGLILVLSTIGVVGIEISFSWLEEIPLWLKVVAACLFLALLLGLVTGDNMQVWTIFAASFAFVVVYTGFTSVWEWLQGLGL